MEKYFKSNILDVIYEAKENKFADNIIKAMEERGEEFKSISIEEQLSNKIKELIKDEKQQKEVLDTLNEYELQIGNENYFWNKMFYKLGVYDCSDMKQIVMNKVDEVLKIKNKNDFFENYSEDIEDYLISNITYRLKHNAEYKKKAQKIEQIKVENPNVRIFLEDKEAVNLTDVEMNAILDIFELEAEMNSLETKECFKIGARDMLVFLKKINLV